ncbi:hypothetical protein [Sphingorhabdus sp.]|jgi:hypothetical protein|uniref:hypothetical protein n=1 Tax=Sphingorhabdus sp. TaxID=1902408 RepID=UPI0035B07682
MARPNESAVQRIQVGVLGLLAVLLFVYIANMILDRVTPMDAASSDAGKPAVSDATKPKDEPLAELGVTPVVEESPDAAGKDGETPQP